MAGFFIFRQRAGVGTIFGMANIYQFRPRAENERG
jgi:hypothetical protein